jgi:hypothetical protein
MSFTAEELERKKFIAKFNFASKLERKEERKRPMSYQYKFWGGDKVLVDACEHPTLLKKSFTGVVIACTNDFPIIGRQYVVLVDHPQEVGLLNSTYPFAAATFSEKNLTKID